MSSTTGNSDRADQHESDPSAKESTQDEKANDEDDLSISEHSVIVIILGRSSHNCLLLYLFDCLSSMGNLIAA